MTPTPTPWLRTLVLAASAGMLCTAQAATVLYQQGPSALANALANGSDGQAPLLAETFTFSGTGNTLSWWGTPAGAFDISLVAGDGTGPVFAKPAVVSTAAGFSVLVDIDGDLQDDTVDVLRYSIDLGALAGGTYTLALRETSTDALGRSWFWLQGSSGDGRSISGLGEPDQQSNPFDLALRVDGTRASTVPEPGTLALVGCALAWARAQRLARRRRA